MMTLQQILNNLLNSLILQENTCSGDLCAVLYDICRDVVPQSVASFSLDEYSINRMTNKVESALKHECPDYSTLAQSISYLLDELICNIQQHAHTDLGYLYATYNASCDMIEIVLADRGVSIYGSYVRTQKYLDLIGDSDAAALGLAKDGYSTKDLPDTESRGYGISSNIKMVARGLNGEFAIYSGNALFLQSTNDIKLLDLPHELDIQGTVVIVRIPAKAPNNYNFYDYIS